MDQLQPIADPLEDPPPTQRDGLREPGECIEILGNNLHVRHLGTDLAGPPLVFLHEGLGSVELWREFPESVVALSRHRGMVYSRYGNGWSTPLRGRRPPDYMHTEALETLPLVLDQCLGKPPILIGHSDGASIALIHAGSRYKVAGLVLIAPHVFVESATISSISTLNDNFAASDLREKMSKYHIEPETTFRGWADIWLSSEFRKWDISEYASGVRCPTLLIQGGADEYGTVDQLDAIDTRLASPAERLIVPDAEHSPHLSHPELVTPAVVEFISRLD